MEQHQDPGISIALIRILAAKVEMVNPTGPHEYSLALMTVLRSEAEGGKFLDVQAAFDVMHGLEKPLFKFTCTFVARYERVGEHSMHWQKFSNAMAITHLIPYLREFVHNMTNRLPTPILILPAINVYAMLSDYEKRKQQSETPHSAST